VTHPHHPLYGQRIQIIRVRRGRDPDLIIRMPDGYHGAIAASFTDYAPSLEAQASREPPPLLSLTGLWQMVQFLEQKRQPETMLPTGQKSCDVLGKRGPEW
jgi:Family of unknown function (DUF5372)